LIQNGTYFFFLAFAPPDFFFCCLICLGSAECDLLSLFEADFLLPFPFAFFFPEVAVLEPSDEDSLELSFFPLPPLLLALLFSSSIFDSISACSFSNESKIIEYQSFTRDVLSLDFNRFSQNSLPIDFMIGGVKWQSWYLPPVGPQNEHSRV